MCQTDVKNQHKVMGIPMLCPPNITILQDAQLVVLALDAMGGRKW